MNKKFIVLVYKLKEKSETRGQTYRAKNNHKPPLTAESKKHKKLVTKKI
jgi:hypothetical protein